MTRTLAVGFALTLVVTACKEKQKEAPTVEPPPPPPTAQPPAPPDPPPKKNAMANKALVLAARAGNVDDVKKALDRGADVHATSEVVNGGTALLPASGKSLEVVKLLLDNGADPNLANRRGFAPIHTAAQAGKGDIAKLLLEKGAKTSARAGPLTPLYMAVQRGHADVVDALLAKEAKVHARVAGMALGKEKDPLTPERIRVASAILERADAPGAMALRGALLKRKHEAALCPLVKAFEKKRVQLPKDRVCK